MTHLLQISQVPHSAVFFFSNLYICMGIRFCCSLPHGLRHLIFQSYTKVFTFVKLPYYKLVEVHHIDSICLHPGPVIQNVLHVPSFQFNLLPISKLSKDTNSWMTFTSTSCLLHDQGTKRNPMIGEQHKGLYTISNSLTNFTPSTLVSSHFDLWHWRLGHPATTLSPQFINLDTSIKFLNNCTCIVCPLAKQSHLKFPSSFISTIRCFELIHFDIWGPYIKKSLLWCLIFSCNGRFFFLEVHGYF